MKIAVAGTGYVGLSLAVLMAQHHEVVALDIVPEKIALLKAKKSPIADTEIEGFLANKSLNFTVTLDKYIAYENVVFIVIVTLIAKNIVEVVLCFPPVANFKL